MHASGLRIPATLSPQSPFVDFQIYVCGQSLHVVERFPKLRIAAQTWAYLG